MIERSYDPDVMRSAFEMLEDDNSDIDCSAWLADIRNVMLVEDGDIGMATFEYPGVYTVHWCYTVRGREAIRLARKMLGVMFDNHGAEAVRGLTPASLKAARWLAKQVGFTSYGFVDMGEKSLPYEIQCMTKQEYKDKVNGS